MCVYTKSQTNTASTTCRKHTSRVLRRTRGSRSRVRLQRPLYGVRVFAGWFALAAMTPVRQRRIAARRAPEQRLSSAELDACAQSVANWSGRGHSGPVVLAYATALPNDWILGRSAAAQALPLVVAGLGLASWPWYEGGSQVITGVRRASQVLRQLFGDAAPVVVADAADTFIPTEPRGSSHAALAAVIADQRRVLVGGECWSWPKCYDALFSDDEGFQGCLATSSTCWPNAGTQLASTRALENLYDELARRLFANRLLPRNDAAMGKIERTNNQAILVRLYRNRSAVRRELDILVDEPSSFFASLRPCGPTGPNPMRIGAFSQCFVKSFVPGAHLHMNGSSVNFHPSAEPGTWCRRRGGPAAARAGGSMQPFLLHANGRHGRLYKDACFGARLEELRASSPALREHPVLLIDAVGRGVCNVTTLGQLADEAQQSQKMKQKTKKRGGRGRARIP